MRYLHGVFEAASRAEMNICADYLKKRADLRDTCPEQSPFPAQIRFRLVHEFEPLPEPKFCHLLHYQRGTNSFKQKLSSAGSHVVTTKHFWHCHCRPT